MTPEYKKIPIDNILYSCGTRQERSTEDFLGIHVVTYVLSGEMQLTLSGGTRHLKSLLCLTGAIFHTAGTYDAADDGTENEGSNCTGAGH